MKKVALWIISSLDLLETFEVAIIQARAPFLLSKLSVGIVDEAPKLGTALDKVGANGIGIPANQPKILAVGIGRVAILDRPRDATPEIHVSELGHVGAVESQSGALEEDLGLLDSKRVVGGGSQRLSVEGSASESSTVGLVHTRSSDSDFEIPPGKDSALDRSIGANSLELLDKRGHDAVKRRRVAVEVSSTIVGRSHDVPSERPSVGAVLAERVVLNGYESLCASLGGQVAHRQGEVDSLVELRLEGLGLCGEDDTKRSACSLGGPEQVRAFLGVDNGSVVQHVLDLNEIIHGGSKVS
ncbi:hypothetical protein HG531_012883 [Fusarium graminearum]|nr:hypothetical protein HG531_012883 [Fusarium graminearum]